MAKPPTQRVLLIRSAATEWDEVGRLQGSTDLPPSGAGLLAVQRELAGLGPFRLAGVLCGPDDASVATAQLVADASGARVIKVAELGEIAYGLWEGILRSDLEERFCRAGRQWGDDPTCVTPPDGESFETFTGRLFTALRRQIAKIGGRRTGVDGKPAIGIVLRPFADAVVRCVLSGRPSGVICSLLHSRPSAAWFEITTDAPWTLTAGPSRSPSVSAA